MERLMAILDDRAALSNESGLRALDKRWTARAKRAWANGDRVAARAWDCARWAARHRADAVKARLAGNVMRAVVLETDSDVMASRFGRSRDM